MRSGTRITEEATSRERFRLESKAIGRFVEIRACEYAWWNQPLPSWRHHLRHSWRQLPFCVWQRSVIIAASPIVQRELAEDIEDDGKKSVDEEKTGSENEDKEFWSRFDRNNKRTQSIRHDKISRWQCLVRYSQFGRLEGLSKRMAIFAFVECFSSCF